MSRDKAVDSSLDSSLIDTNIVSMLHSTLQEMSGGGRMLPGFVSDWVGYMCSSSSQLQC